MHNHIQTFEFFAEEVGKSAIDCGSRGEVRALWPSLNDKVQSVDPKISMILLQNMKLLESVHQGVWPSIVPGGQGQAKLAGNVANSNLLHVFGYSLIHIQNCSAPLAVLQSSFKDLGSSLCL